MNRNLGGKVASLSEFTPERKVFFFFKFLCGKGAYINLKNNNMNKIPSHTQSILLKYEKQQKKMKKP